MHGLIKAIEVMCTTIVFRYGLGRIGPEMSLPIDLRLILTQLPTCAMVAMSMAVAVGLVLDSSFTSVSTLLSKSMGKQ